jgi:hypothetical protein
MRAEAGVGCLFFGNGRDSAPALGEAWKNERLRWKCEQARRHTVIQAARITLRQDRFGAAQRVAGKKTVAPTITQTASCTAGRANDVNDLVSERDMRAVFHQHICLSMIAYRTVNNGSSRPATQGHGILHGCLLGIGQQYPVQIEPHISNHGEQHILIFDHGIDDNARPAVAIAKHISVSTRRRTSDLLEQHDWMSNPKNR